MTLTLASFFWSVLCLNKAAFLTKMFIFSRKDQLIIGFINDSTHKRTNSIRYNAKARTSMEDSNKNFKDQSKCNTDAAQEIGDRQHQDNTPNSRKR